jgi:PAS domain S-box-containing protein
MTQELLRLLLVEDSEDDSLLVVRELQKGGFTVTSERVETVEGLRAALKENSWDIIISDYALPRFSGPQALTFCQGEGVDVPFIIVSGAIGEEVAVQLMKAGAHDYVMKDNLPRLPEAVRRELGAARERSVRREAEAARSHLAAIVESCDDAVVGKTQDGTITSWNGGAERLYGFTAAEMIGRSVSLLVPPSRPRELPEIYELLKQGHRLERFETVRRRKDGTLVEVAVTVSPIKDPAGRVVGASSVARDISQRKEEERERLRLIEELSEALAHVKTLSGLLPICAGCKKIRDDGGYWQAVEVYIKEHSNADFTHGLCPDCAQRLYPEYPLRV